MKGFGSDNHAGVLPEVLAAIGAANVGHAPSYGHDPLTERVEARFAELLGRGAQAFLVFNGSGANVLSLRAVLRPWEGVVLADTAHLNVDVQEQALGVGQVGDRAHLARRVERAHLGRLGDRDDPRLDRVLVAHAHDLRAHEVCRQLAVTRWCERPARRAGLGAVS